MDATNFSNRTQEHLALVVQNAADHYQDVERLQWLGAPSPLAVSSYLGDIALRFVFRSHNLPDLPVHLQDLVHLTLSPQRAMVVAIGNFKRANGTPLTGEFVRGVHMLRGANADVYANYLLDRAFWRSQLARFPQGVLVAIPKRGSLFFVDAADAPAVAELTRIATRLFTTAGAFAISRFLYRFGERGWLVHGPLPTAPTESTGPAPPVSGAASGLRAARAEEQVQEDDLLDAEAGLLLAARGQKMVILSIVGNFVLRAIEQSQALPGAALLLLTFGVAVYGLVGAVRMCSGLNKLQGEKIIFMVLSFIPLANIISLIYLSMKTSKILRKAGWTVGLFGARL